MDERILAMVRAAGLERALAEFPEDVVASSEMAERHRADFTDVVDPRAEPWPPMRIPNAS